MRLAIQICSWLVGIPLELLVLAALLRGGYRRFPFLFLYVVGEFLTTVAEIPASWAYIQGTRNIYGSVWWFDQGVAQLLIYAAVFSLLWRATDRLAGGRTFRMLSVLAAAAFAAGSLAIHVYAGTPGWHAAWIRDLNFCSVILDLVLWSFLVAKRGSDSQLLLLSSGFGVQFCGGAIGEALRQMSVHSRSRALSLSGGLIIMASYLLFLFIWWRALRPAENPAARPATQPAGQ